MRDDIQQVITGTRPATTTLLWRLISPCKATLEPHQETPLFYPAEEKRPGEGEEMQEGKMILQTPGAGRGLRSVPRLGNQHLLKGIIL